ncbi:SAM-dependent methyltransferase [Agarivorans sp. B2Z047]|uniref:tRNA (adenine(22)-N(1))-methyltransferase n=1 Tax=Agarivorans sp. B2Z047 TaxID=2652721 RepID=UPI0014064DDC|nr:tRNA (adenine(22)-N(1))-methyltransferase TrmK [Agarivorans sp. B2Z047]MPW29399.1 SAM-dependent methyltransferase [Agarivorans sp. B2Z047]UQN44989.1 tRNA (adenine(22)-N(1))-methyltransferase TrmK [Agarivorans sp. B2Z047]
MKTSKRLTAINQHVIKHYQDIWDCCCDHGLLGAELVKRNSASCVHFVDCVPQICQQLERQLQQHLAYSSSSLTSPWQVHCQDVAQLKLSKNGSQLVIIAGVGGELCIQLLKGILEHNHAVDFELIICPVHYQYELRQFLQSNGFGLIDEQLIEENRRYYEILHLSTTANSPISHVGDAMWDLSKPEHRAYLNKTIAHYCRMGGKTVHPALRAYETLQKKSSLDNS